MNTNDIRFWERLWQDYREASPQRRRRRTKAGGPLDRWNKMAADFAENTGGPKREAERRAVIQRLMAQNALRPGAAVLDIGAGPGSWTCMLAETVGHVTALEPADGMADIMKNRIATDNIDNITIDRRTWQSVDLDADGWRGKFDLVFASMTPGIDGPESLLKMMAASRDACYLSAFSGSNWRSQYADLWQTFFNEPIGEQPGDIIYPLNLVYAMGFRPSLEFAYWTRKQSMNREKAVERFTLFFETYMPMTEGVKTVITDHVNQRCVDGRYTDARDVCRGMMIWNIAQHRSAARPKEAP